MRKSSVVLTAAFLISALFTTPAQADQTTFFQLLLDSANAQLAAQGSNLQLESIEWLTVNEGEEVGAIVFFNDRGNKQLDFADWVPFDPRRDWNPSSAVLTYLVDESDGATNDGLTNADTEAAIDRAMDTWTNTTQCSDLTLVKATDPGVDPDFTDALLGFGGFGDIFADVTHAGWVPPGIFGPNLLGVTFSFRFVNPATGQPTDINGDGKGDAAVREIYYNDTPTWRIDGNIDVESVALHEMGHGLSQAHFGALFLTPENGKFHFAPRAVMNAAYTGPQQSLKPTDLAGHCSLWGNWPNR